MWFLCGVAALVAACGSAPDAADQDAALSLPPEAPAADAASAAPAAAPASAGTATVTFRGPGVDISGEFPAHRCGGGYFIHPEQKGVVYATRFEGYELIFGDTEHRVAGVQNVDGSYSQLTLGTADRLYGIPEGERPRVTLSEDFRTAEIRSAMTHRAETERYQLEATFRCR